MPELPEVETVRRTLLPQIKNKKIIGIEIPYDKIVQNNPDEFKKNVIGETFLDIDRTGKYLIFRLTNNKSIVSHLRMEGKYHVVPTDSPINKHEHLMYQFEDGTSLRYQDTRKFGRLELVETGTENVVTGIKNLGPEPNSAGFTLKYFTAALKKRKKNIKNAILDQTLVAGLGNIYVDEVLWMSEIHPLQPANTIPTKKIKKLYQAINEEIALAIENHGTTVKSYLDASGHAGNFQNFLHAYSRGGEKCERCGTILEKIKVNGRGTVFCPHDQVLS